jgi:hypothetical protein
MRGVNRFALVAGFAVSVTTLVVWRIIVRWSLSAFEVVFFTLPVGFVLFLFWQAILYHIVSLGDPPGEWGNWEEPPDEQNVSSQSTTNSEKIE